MPNPIQVPCAQRVPSDWVKVCSTRSRNRYHPPQVLTAVDRLTLAKEEHSGKKNRGAHTRPPPPPPSPPIQNFESDPFLGVFVRVPAAVFFWVFQLRFLFTKNIFRAPESSSSCVSPPSGACNRAWESLLGGFSGHYVAFRGAVQSLAALDCLHALGQVAQNPVSFFGGRFVMGEVYDGL